jgi:hypothetical protein
MSTSLSFGKFTVLDETKNGVDCLSFSVELSTLAIFTFICMIVFTPKLLITILIITAIVSNARLYEYTTRGLQSIYKVTSGFYTKKQHPVDAGSVGDSGPNRPIDETHR